MSDFQNASWQTAADVHAFTSKHFVVSSVVPGPTGADHVGFADAFFGNLWCPCEVCSREFVCEHVVAVRLMLGEVTLPPEHAQFKGKKKRQRGRPAKGTGGGVRFGKHRETGFESGGQDE